MNTPNPLLPQGSLPQRGKSSVYFKVLMIVAIHTVLIGGILMVGCKDANKQSSATPPDETTAATASAPSPMSTTDLASPATTGPAAPSATTTSVPVPAVGPAATVPPAADTHTTAGVPAVGPVGPTAGAAKEYVIQKGDLLSTIAKKNGVSLKALEDANPGLDPKKLQINNKLQIPAATATASASSPASSGASALAGDSTAAAGDSTTYTVKTGDALLKIAKTHGTTVAAIESLNNMKTASIKAGQKLKLPVVKVASVSTAAPAPAAPAVPPSGTATAPATTTY